MLPAYLLAVVAELVDSRVTDQLIDWALGEFFQTIACHAHYSYLLQVYQNI